MTLRIPPLASLLTILCAAPAVAQSDLPVTTVRKKEAPPQLLVEPADKARISQVPRYYLDTIDNLNRTANDTTRTAPGLAKNDYLGRVFEVRNCEAIELQTYLLKMLSFEGGTCEVMAADDVADENGKVEYLFVTAPDFMMPGIEDLVRRCDRAGFAFDDSTGKDFGDGPGYLHYVCKHRTASELVAILSATSLSSFGTLYYTPFADDSTNTIFLYDNPTNIGFDKEMLEKFDRPPLQVEIECTIYEVDVTDGCTLGLDWDAWKRSLTGGLTYTSQSKGSFFSSSNDAYSTILRLDAEALIEFLNFTVTHGHGNVLTASRITMVNSEDLPGAITGGGARGSASGQPAVIESITPLPFANLQADVGATNAQNARNEQLTFEGVRVEILPFIGAESVTLQVAVQVNSVAGISPETHVPLVSERSMNSLLNTVDGKSLVIAGVDKTSQVDTRSGIPLLMDIPWLGALFRVDDSETRRSKIFIAITPRLKDAAVLHETATDGK